MAGREVFYHHRSYSALFANLLTGYFELTAIGLLLLILYASSKVFSKAPFYLATGIYLVFAVISDLPDVIGLTVNMPSNIDSLAGTLWLPALLLFLIIYERDGTQAAHQFFVGITILFALFFCLSTIFANETGLNVNPLFWLLTAEGKRIIVQGVATITVLLLADNVLLLLLLPIIYQSLRNRRLPYFFGIFMALTAYLLLNEIMASVILKPLMTGAFSPAHIIHFKLWPTRLLLIGIFSVIGQIYLRYTETFSLPFFRRNLAIFTELSSYLRNTNQMRQNLEEWRERYNIVMQYSNELICLLSPDGSILNANSKATNILGRFLASPGFMLWELISTSNGENVYWPDIVKLLATRTNYRHEIDLRNLVLTIDDEHHVDIDLHLTLVNQDGRHTILFIANDITARLAEEQRRINMAESVVHSQRLESLGILAGGVAHEFNNLLLSCRASLDMLYQHDRLQNDDRKLLDTVNDACTRCASLTSQLLGFARRGKHTEEPVELRRLYDHILALFKPLAKNIDLKVICQPVPLIVDGDEKQLGQVLLNLLINARDACKDTEEPRIVLRTETASDDMPGWELHTDPQAVPENYICMRVRDNGQGMTEEVKSKIFEPFFTTKGPGAGTGMGLAMVFGTINQHHGWINVISSPNHGATFEIFLPKSKTNLDTDNITTQINPEKITGVKQ